MGLVLRIPERYREEIIEGGGKIKEINNKFIITPPPNSIIPRIKTYRSVKVTAYRLSDSRILYIEELVSAWISDG